MSSVKEEQFVADLSTTPDRLQENLSRCDWRPPLRFEHWEEISSNVGGLVKVIYILYYALKTWNTPQELFFVSSVRSSNSHTDLLLTQHPPTPLFQITPVRITGLSLSEPLQLYKGYNAI